MASRISLVVSMFLFALRAWAQTCGIGLSLAHDVFTPCSTMTATMKEDALGRPYLYVANKELGLTLYSLTGTPALVHSVPVSLYDSLQVMNLSQTGNYVYLAIGNHHGGDVQRAGMAIVDVSDPLTAFVTDYWVDTASSHGAAIVEVEGDHAYLGELGDGLTILNVSNKADIVFESNFKPSSAWPTLTPFAPNRWNSRGLAVRDGIVYLCQDAGGLRIINATNPAAPVETGRHTLPLGDTVYRYYNNIALQGNLAYISLDHFGLEIVDVSDTSNLTQVGWLNAWGNSTTTASGIWDPVWVASRGYANEISLDTVCKRAFLSTGRNDLLVVDVSDPASPDSCDSWGNATDTMGTWGVSATSEHVYLGYICAPYPFLVYVNAIRILDIGVSCPAAVPEPSLPALEVFPNPTTGHITLPTDAAQPGQWVTLTVTDALGRVLHCQSQRWEAHEVELLLPDAPGLYFVSLLSVEGISSAKVIRP